MLIKIPLIGPFLPSTQKDIDVVPELYSDYPSLVKQDWVAGTAMMLRKDTLQEIGGLDEAIFMYAEDMELCVRAKDHHWDVAIVPGAYITHHKTASSNPGKALLGEMKGYQYIWAKHKAAWQLGIATLLMKAGASLRILLFGTMRQPEKVRTYKTALQEL
jgi:GT2 family glycosyltransferase